MEKEDAAKVAEVSGETVGASADESPSMVIPTSFYEQIKNERKGRIRGDFLHPLPEKEWFYPPFKLELFECSGYAERKLVKTGRVALVNVNAIVPEVDPNSQAVDTFYEFDVLDTYLEIPGGARFDDPPAAELAKLVERRMKAFEKPSR